MSRKLSKSVERLRKELIEEHWMWNFSWRYVKLETLETMYGVPSSEILSIMREIAKTMDPPDASELSKIANAGRCRSCGMRIVWGRQNGDPHPLDPKVLNIITLGEMENVRGRESHFVSCPNANQHRKGKR